MVVDYQINNNLFKVIVGPTCKIEVKSSCKLSVEININVNWINSTLQFKYIQFGLTY